MESFDESATHGAGGTRTAAHGVLRRNAASRARTTRSNDLRTAVAAMFESRCSRCHNASDPSAGLTLAGGDVERSLVGVWSYLDDEYLLVSPGAPEQSFLIKVLRGKGNIQGAHTPASGSILSDAETDLVARWITSLADTDGQAP